MLICFCCWALGRGAAGIAYRHPLPGVGSGECTSTASTANMARMENVTVAETGDAL